MQQIKQYIMSMNAEHIIAAANVLSLVIAVALGLIIYNLTRAGIESDIYNRIKISSKNYIKNLLLNSDNSRYNYSEIEEKLLSKGYKYYFKDMDPNTYMTYKFGIAAAGAVVGRIVFGWLGLVAGTLLGYFCIDIYVHYLDKKDNEEMLNDIRMMLGSIKIQNKASMHVVRSLTECYYIVSNKRLKKALLEFSGDINAKVELDTALDNLNKKFNNKYMGSFCSAIKQSIKTGMISNIAESISTQMMNIQKVMIIKERSKAETDKSIATVLIFAIIMMFIFISVMYSIDVEIF